MHSSKGSAATRTHLRGVWHWEVERATCRPDKDVSHDTALNRFLLIHVKLTKGPVFGEEQMKMTPFHNLES